MKKYDQHKMKRTQIRQDKIRDGFFDGRFVSRVEEPKSLYSRKIKHKNRASFFRSSLILIFLIINLTFLLIFLRYYL